MAKIGDGVPRLIDKAVDFMASSQAFMEYLKKSPRLQHVPRDIPQDKDVVSAASGILSSALPADLRPDGTGIRALISERLFLS